MVVASITLKNESETTNRLREKSKLLMSRKAIVKFNERMTVKEGMTVGESLGSNDGIKLG